MKNFVVVYGDPGLGDHSLGRLPQLAATTHRDEVKKNAFPGVPPCGPTDNVVLIHASSLGGLVGALAIGNIVYLAYFGHSWNGDEKGTFGVLYIGENPVPDSNLSNGKYTNCTATTVLPPFRSDGQVRLFGCRGGFGENSSAD